MKYRVLGVSAALLALGAAAIADTAADKKAIIKAYATMDAALKRKNVEQQLQFMDPKFIMVSHAGVKYDAAKTKSMLRQLMASVQTVTVSVSKIKKLVVTGNRADVLVTSFMAATIPEPASQKNPGKLHKLAQTSEDRDTWTKTAAGWRVTGEVEASAVATFDGKPLPGQ